MPISQDDLLDVMEMAESLESHMFKILKDNQIDLALSALMSSTINYIIDRGQNLDEVIFYRNIFVEMFDSSIELMKSKEK